MVQTPAGLPVILSVVGARPNFMKIAPIQRALAAGSGLHGRLVHTGQHYDEAMSDSFFADLGIDPPDVNLAVGSGSHAVQTAEIMRRFEPVLDEARPACVLVVGDVNSTLAAALVAAKKGVQVVHVEAGLRSFDRSMPEEVNRVLTDQIADLLFTTERGALDNLVREGIDAGRVHFVGNVMIDTLRANLARAVPARETIAGLDGTGRLAEDGRGYAVLTLHRPSNVDDPAALRALMGTLMEAAERLPIVFPAHPRTRTRIADAGLEPELARSNVLMTSPVPYLAMLGLLAEARAALTDSGGIQEETTALGVPCFTLRTSTERPITIDEGTNTMVGIDRGRILGGIDDLLATGGKAGRVPELWDGQAAGRIVRVLASTFAGSRTPAA
jgi:UDP-N-acetylglucosamine 2-epimerase (non-hydrolysing)